MNLYGCVEQELPSDEPCLSLLTTWNDSVGKEKNFLNVADSLNKVGNKKLAEWLSDTIFTKLSMDLNDCILQNTTKAVTNITASEVFISSGPNLYIRPEIKYVQKNTLRDKQQASAKSIG